MQDGTKAESVPPGRTEVGDLHPLVTLCDFLSPFQERLTGSHQAGRGQPYTLQHNEMVLGTERLKKSCLIRGERRDMPRTQRNCEVY